jgi:Zn-dependent protease with chaperone function
VIGGLVGWRFNFQLAKHHIIARLNTTTVFERALIAGSIIWTASTMVLLAFFDVIDRPIDWWTEAEIAHALLLWLGPIFAGCLLASLVSWVSRGVTGSRS